MIYISGSFFQSAFPLWDARGSSAVGENTNTFNLKEVIESHPPTPLTIMMQSCWDALSKNNIGNEISAVNSKPYWK